MRKALTTLSMLLALIATQVLATPAAPSELTTAGSFLVAADEKAKAHTSKGASATPATPAVPGTPGTPAKPAIPATPATPKASRS
ncbi:hypothetical protein D3C78_604140 [compost metagenome]